MEFDEDYFGNPEFSAVAHTKQAYTIKSLVKLLKENFPQSMTFTFDENGISSSCSDSNMTLLMSYALRADNFEQYKCTTPITVEIVTSELYACLKSLKKKDELLIYVKKYDSESETPPQMAFVVYYANTQKIDKEFIAYAEKNVIDYKDNTKFNKPYGMSSIEFSKTIKKMWKNIGGRVIKLSAVEDRYIEFECDIGTQRSVSQFGKKSSSEELTYQQSFITAHFSNIHSINGISKKIYIYVPKNPSDVLKITGSIGDLGDIVILIAPK